MLGLNASPADRRLLREGRSAGPMPWVIAIMMFLTVLAAAAGLALGGAASALDAGLKGKLTIQLAEASPAIREAQVKRILTETRRLAAVESATPVPEAQLAEMLRPWLGDDSLEADLPLPALIDVVLRRATAEDVALVTQTVKAAAPAARIDPHAKWLAPLAGLLDALTWLAVALVVLMAVATSAVVVLAARGAVNTHRATIDVMHLLGASDAQVARLFQRRIALDALFGGGLGLLAGLVVMLLVGQRMRDIGSELLGSAGFSWGGWLMLFLLPLAGALLATLCARLTVLASLRKAL
jgi:cell division transport system permease protein